MGEWISFLDSQLVELLAELDTSRNPITKDLKDLLPNPKRDHQFYFYDLKEPSHSLWRLDFLRLVDVFTG